MDRCLIPDSISERVYEALNKTNEKKTYTIASTYIKHLVDTQKQINKSATDRQNIVIKIAGLTKRKQSQIFSLVIG